MTRSLLILALCAWPAAAQDEPPPSPVPAETLVGDVFDVRVDVETGRLALLDDEGGTIVEFPLGAVIRPSRPALRFMARVDGVETLAIADDPATGVSPGIAAALFHLSSAGSEAEVGVGVRAGPFGPVFSYGFAADVFRGLTHRTETRDVDGRPVTVGRDAAGRPVTVAGERIEEAVAVAAPGRIRLLIDERFSELSLGTFRLRGALAVTDSGEDDGIRLRVIADGVEIGGAVAGGRGEDPRAFDVALKDARELVLDLSPAGDGLISPTAALLDATFVGPGDAELRLTDLLLDDRAGLDLLVDASGGLTAAGGVRPLAPEPDPRRDAIGAIDATASEFASVSPGPLLLPFETGGGWFVGVGLGWLPDATRFAASRGGVSLSLPTMQLGVPPDEMEEGEEPERIRVLVAVVAARTLPELYARYRSTLIATGGSATRRAVGSLTVPEWWRHPLLFCSKPPGRGRFGRFDVHEVEKRVAEIESRLGLDDFTVVIDGPWNSRVGDPRPAEEFSRLRGLAAAQHVKGRHVLLRWPLLAAEPGSLADVIGVQRDGRIDSAARKKMTAFFHEVVRACLVDGLHSLGADGLVFSGVADLVDPTRSAVTGFAAAGTGLRELGTVLRSLKKEVDRRELDSLLAAPCALPQLVTEYGAILFSPGTSDAATRDDRLERIVAVIPDQPILSGPLDAAPQEIIEWAARMVAIGVPSIGSRALSALDDEQARSLGAFFRLATARPLGIPERVGAGWRMAYDGRVLAETLEARAGVAVFPERAVALLALTRAGDVRLPFDPVDLVDAEEASIEFEEGAAVLRGGRPGVIYRFRTE